MPPSSTLQSAGDGDLWPSCWSDDGNLYAANGDGKGFSLGGASSDVAVSRIAGAPGSLSGSTIASGDGVGLWSGEAGAEAADGYVYAYGLDRNWRFTGNPGCGRHQTERAAGCRSRRRE